MKDPHVIAHLSATEALRRFAAGDLSPVELTNVALERIEGLEPSLNAFQVIDADGARRAAELSARRWTRGEPIGPLDGVPLTIKDIVLTAGWPTRSGSRTVEPEQPWTEDAPSVARLREAGAVLLGKTTTPEFGWKGMTDSPLSGVTRNPWSLEHTPGGSSGGAAAALAAGIGSVAHGTDGGGSVRIPASYCGLVGLKPTFGRVPHYPYRSPYSTLSANGPLTRTVEDAALLLGVLARPDRRDPHAVAYDGHDYRDGLWQGIEGWHIAVSFDFGGADPSGDVVEHVRHALDRLRDLGARVEDVGPLIPPLRERFEAYWLAGFAFILNQIPAERRGLMDPQLRELAERGCEVDLAAYYRGDRARAELAMETGRLYERFDLLVTPTMPTPPPLASTVYHSAEFDRWRHAVAYTVAFNLTGQPALSLPCGITENGLPIGVQIIGARFDEAKVLRAGQALEGALDFPQPHPRLLARLTELDVGE